MMKKSILFLSLILGSMTAEARVFDMSKASFAPYLRGTYMPAQVTDGVFSGALGAGSTVSQTTIPYDASGEIGFVYGGKPLSIRLGIEYLLLPRVSENANKAGTDMYTIDSQATVLIPKMGFEINLKSWQEVRLFLLLSGGYANLASKTSYSFLPASTYGMSNFSESLKGTAVSGEAALGFEGLLSDATTYAIEAGYRYLNFTSLTYSNSDTNFQGAFSSGSPALNTDGSKRTLNLSNIFVGFSFRFYLH